MPRRRPGVIELTQYSSGGFSVASAPLPLLGRAGYASSRPGSLTSSMRFRPAVSARRPCFRASASLPNNSRRQPDSAGTGALSSAAIASRSSDEAISFCATCEILDALLQKHPQQLDQRPDARRRLGLAGDARAAGSGPRVPRPPRRGCPGRACPRRRRWPRLRVRASCSIVFGACAAISSTASSFMMRPRGRSRCCAAVSRHAATAFSTPRNRRSAGPRSRKRRHASSGSVR